MGDKIHIMRRKKCILKTSWSVFVGPKVLMLPCWAADTKCCFKKNDFRIWMTLLSLPHTSCLTWCDIYLPPTFTNSNPHVQAHNLNHIHTHTHTHSLTTGQYQWYEEVLVARQLHALASSQRSTELRGAWQRGLKSSLSLQPLGRLHTPRTALEKAWMQV